MVLQTLKPDYHLTWSRETLKLDFSSIKWPTLKYSHLESVLSRNRATTFADVSDFSDNFPSTAKTFQLQKFFYRLPNFPHSSQLKQKLYDCRLSNFMFFPTVFPTSSTIRLNLVLISKRIEFSRPKNPKIHKFFFGLDHFRWWDHHHW